MGVVTGYLPHQVEDEGLVIWKAARVEPTRVLMTTNEASRKLNIFLDIKKKLEKPLVLRGEGARERTGQQQRAKQVRVSMNEEKNKSGVV
jgi:hypothetical protein